MAMPRLKCGRRCSAHGRGRFQSVPDGFCRKWVLGPKQLCPSSIFFFENNVFFCPLYMHAVRPHAFYVSGRLFVIFLFYFVYSALFCQPNATQHTTQLTARLLLTTIPLCHHRRPSVDPALPDLAKTPCFWGGCPTPRR
jgi:hypothetical protein